MLKEHNKPIFKDMEKMLLDCKKAIVITGTGTGKSYLTLEFIKKYKLKALVVIPYNSLAAQWSNLSKNITTCTYVYFKKHESDILNSDFNIVIFDEAQHCGAKTWQFPIEHFMKNTDKYVLGLSADAKRYSDAGKDMATYLWGDKIIYGYDLEEAVEKGILPKITYVSSLYNTDGFEDIFKNDKVSKVLIGRLNNYIKNMKSVKSILKKYMPTARKSVVFVDSVERVADFKNTIMKAYPGIPIYTIHSKQSYFENKRQLDEFEKSKESFIFSINMLNEGLHAKGANTCIMFRSTSSPTIYFQQIGRSLSTDGTNSLVFDFVSNRYKLSVINFPDIVQSKIFKKSMTNCKKSSQIIIKDYTEELCNIIADIKKSLDDKWTEDELSILYKYYPIEGKSVYKRLENRSATACAQKAISLDIRFNFWSQDKIDYIIDNYKSLGPKKISEYLGISIAAVKSKARELNITNSDRVKKWTAELDKQLIRKFKKYDTKCYTMMDGFSRDAVRKRLQRLNVEVQNKRRWTDEENSILLNNIDKSYSELVKLLPQKTKSAISHKLSKLKHKE